MANKIETSSKNIKPRINLNHNIYIDLLMAWSHEAATQTPASLDILGGYITYTLMLILLKWMMQHCLILFVVIVREKQRLSLYK